MLHWQACVTDTFLSMVAKADPDALAEIARRVLPALRLPVDTPSDLAPIHGSFHDIELGGESG
jgi:hypothetical protein